MKENIDLNGVYLHDWVFHYNAIYSLWFAVPRELYSEYCGNYRIENVIKSHDIHTLIALINKYKGSVDSIINLK
jgi:hypothetical protein